MIQCLLHHLYEIRVNLCQTSLQRELRLLSSCSLLSLSTKNNNEDNRKIIISSQNEYQTL